ncbi:MAG: hypothetical protein AB9891_00340 [Anaerolineaceae bacterium]
MSYHEKSSILSIINFPLVYGGYWVYVLQNLNGDNPGLNSDLSFWGASILIFVGVSVVTRIILEILFNIANAIATRRADDISFEDERDRLFELKSNRVSAYVVGFGFLLSLVTLVLKWPPYIMLNVLYFAFIASVMTAEIIKLRYYRKGM